MSPPAEIDVDEAMIRRLLAEQHPDLAELPLVERDAGWDNTIWRLGDDMLVRLPRRMVAAALTINEQRWLPELAPRLPLPTPAPIRIGRPTEEYPWPWSVVPWFDGLPGDQAEIIDPRGVAIAFGGFFKALHVDAPADAPHNPYRGVPLLQRADTLDERLTELATEVDAAALRRVWDDALSASSRRGPPSWIHADAHPANLLIANGTLAAIIDFGDLCAGDPATDLAAAWMLLPTTAMDAFRSAYGGVDDDLERRARGWAVLFGLMFLEIGVAGAKGLPGGRPTYEPIGRATLARLIETSA